MCCFSRSVKLVADTNIFARGAGEGRQFLVYGMRVDAPEELAMILPLPVPARSKEDAVRFISLEKYPRFFDDLRAGFPEPLPPRAPAGGKSLGGVGAAPLKVEQVGAYEASFVPALKDFPRLDERFRLPEDVWEKLPEYKDFGFAVFKLKKGSQKVHPMAFEFPRADAKKLFFPTVHIHDGTVEPRARFDHALYCQGSGMGLMAWKESPKPAGMFMKSLKKRWRNDTHLAWRWHSDPSRLRPGGLIDDQAPTDG